MFMMEANALCVSISVGVFDPASKNDMKMTRPEGDHAIYCNSKASTSLP